MNIKSHYLIIAFIGCSFLVTKSTYSQSERKQTFPISISLTNHSWAFPFKEVFRVAPIYPGISAETKFYYKKGKRFDLFQTGQLGGFINQSSGSALYLNSNLGVQYTTDFGLTTNLSIGLGYFNSMYTSATYKQKPNGSYEKTNRIGIGSMSSNIALGLGYDFEKKYDKNFALFINYQWVASTVYWSLITIRPNGLVHIGGTFYPFSKK